MQSNESVRDPALVRLDALVGGWTVEASIPLIGPTPIGGFTQFEWSLGGQFLVQRSEVSHPDAPDCVAIIGLDLDRGAYTQHYFDSRGVARVYAMGFRDGVWNLLRDSPDFSPLTFRQRFTGTLGNAGDTIKGRWETSHDGVSWEHDFDLTYAKVT